MPRPSITEKGGSRETAMKTTIIAAMLVAAGIAYAEAAPLPPTEGCSTPAKTQLGECLRKNGGVCRLRGQRYMWTAHIGPAVRDCMGVKVSHQ